jgi:hypothetical protein
MTLKEKFIDAFKSGKRFDIQNAEQIADDYAIEFAKWGGMPVVDIDVEELLEIFKKEKEL